MRLALLLALAPLGCATVPRGSAVCVDQSGSASNPTIDPPVPGSADQVSDCADYRQAVALAQKLARDAGVDWRTLASVRVRSVTSWKDALGHDVTGNSVGGVADVDRCLALLLHEDLHWVDAGITGIIPPGEWGDTHAFWVANGYWALESFFEWLWSQVRATNTDCHIFRTTIPDPSDLAKSVPLNTTMPPPMESMLRTNGWGPKLDQWRAAVASGRRSP